MPYVRDEIRDKVDVPLSHLVSSIKQYIEPSDYCGTLNYCITETVVSILKNKYGDKWRYAGINDMIGVLECCKLELYRRAGSSYEDQCITRNGDVKAYE